MRVTMLLADAAQVVENKLYILGGGWSMTGPDPVPSAIALKIEVPWDQTNDRHRWEMALIDADSQPVFMQGPDGEQALVINGEFEVGRPAGVAAGTPIDLALAINLGPIPLPPGRRFVWELTIDGQSHADWQLGFAANGALQLGLRHLRAALDALVASLVVELFLGPAARTTMRTKAAATRRRDVTDRRSTRRPRLAVLRPLLVDGAGRDLLGLVVGPAPILEAFLDVLVLPFALFVPCSLRHTG